MVTARELELYRNDEVLKESELALQEYQYALNEYMYVESTIDSVLKLRLHASNIKVINESGNMDDLALLTNAALNEAAEAADANKVSLWQKFKNFLTRLWNSIQKLFTGVDTNAFKELQKKGGKIKVGSGIKELVDAAETVGNEMDRAKGAAGKIAAAIGAVAGISITGVGIKSWLSKKESEADVVDEDGTVIGKGSVKEIDAAEAENLLTRAKNAALKLFGKAKDEIDENAPVDQNTTEGTSILSKLGNLVTKYVVSPITKGLSKVGIKKDAATSNQTNQQNTEQTTEQQPTQNQQTQPQQQQNQQPAQPTQPVQQQQNNNNAQ